MGGLFFSFGWSFLRFLWVVYIVSGAPVGFGGVQFTVWLFWKGPLF